MYLIDYHTHPYGHGEDHLGTDVEAVLLQFINQARKMGIREVGFSDHDWVLDKVDWDCLKKIKNTSKLKVRLGLEVDYKPEQEREIKAILNKLPLDYCIGSVHSIGNWEIDHPDYIDEYDNRNLNYVYHDYFATVKKAVLSGLFDIIGHLDLIKVFGFRPEGINILQVVNPVLEAIKKNGLVMEINTNGLNKPVKEIYPEMSIIKRAYELGIPLTIGSDAHKPERVGEGLKEIIGLMKRTGYRKLAVFKKRKMNFKSLEPEG